MFQKRKDLFKNVGDLMKSKIKLVILDDKELIDYEDIEFQNVMSENNAKFTKKKRSEESIASRLYLLFY
jgi:hypothetical protein